MNIQTVENIYRKWVDERWGPSNRFAINNGWCSDFCLLTFENIPHVQLCSDHPEHAFVKIGHLYYDVEDTQGVSDWKNLIYYNKHALIRDRIPNPQIVSLKEFCTIWNFDYNKIVQSESVSTTKDSAVIKALTELGLRKETPLSPEQEQLLKQALNPDEQYYTDIIRIFESNTWSRTEAINDPTSVTYGGTLPLDSTRQLRKIYHYTSIQNAIRIMQGEWILPAGNISSQLAQDVYGTSDGGKYVYFGLSKNAAANNAVSTEVLLVINGEPYKNKAIVQLDKEGGIVLIYGGVPKTSILLACIENSTSSEAQQLMALLTRYKIQILHK